MKCNRKSATDPLVWFIGFTDVSLMHFKLEIASNYAYIQKEDAAYYAQYYAGLLKSKFC